MKGIFGFKKATTSLFFLNIIGVLVLTGIFYFNFASNLVILYWFAIIIIFIAGFIAFFKILFIFLSFFNKKKKRENLKGLLPYIINIIPSIVIIILFFILYSEYNKRIEQWNIDSEIHKGKIFDRSFL